MEKKAIYFNDFTLEIIEKARQMWPESADNVSEVVRKMVADWDRIRANGGGRNQQVNERLDRHEALLIRHEALLVLMCDHFGIVAEDDSDVRAPLY